MSFPALVKSCGASFPVLDELFGEYSPLLYALKTQLFESGMRAALEEFEAALRARADELSERECGKLRLPLRRRWKAIA